MTKLTPLLPPRYQDPQVLGQGGMGVVYRARDVSLGREVAVKLVRADKLDSPTLRPRFFREVRVLGSLNHPNVVRAFDTGEWQGSPYFTMELVEGTTLGAALAEKTLPLPRVVELLVQVADALAAVHGAGILHRDLKPANVMVTRQGVAKLMDFGLSKEFGDDATALTRTGQLVGTLHYLAPEILRGNPASERSDVYSLGAVAYTALTGRVPATGPELVQAVLSGRSLDVPPPTAAGGAGDGDLDALVLAACAFEPADRTPTAALVRDGLTAWLDAHQGPQAIERRPAAAPVATGALRVRRSPWPALAALGVALVVLGLSFVVGLEPPLPSPAPSPVAALSAEEAAAFKKLRAKLLDPATLPEEYDLELLADLAGRQGLLSRLSLDKAAPASSAGLYYLARFASSHGPSPRAAELYALLVRRADARPPRPADQLLEQAQEAARSSGHTGPLEEALEAAAAREADPAAAAPLWRRAFDFRLVAWRARDRVLSSDWESWRSVDPSALRIQERRLERALAMIRPLATKPPALEEDALRLLEALALRGLSNCRDELDKLVLARLGASRERGTPPASAALLVRAACLLTHAWLPLADDIGRALGWLERAVPLARDDETRARALDLLAHLSVRAAGDGKAPEPKRIAEALGFLDRADALRTGAATCALLATTRARVLDVLERPSDGLAVLSSVSERDLGAGDRWWFLRVKGALLYSLGKKAEGEATTLAAYRETPPELRAYMASLVQALKLMQLLRDPTGGRGAR